MNEETLNASVRKFLRQVGVGSQREIEAAIRAALADGRLAGDEGELDVSVRLSLPAADLDVVIDGTVELG